MIPPWPIVAGALLGGREPCALIALPELELRRDGYTGGKFNVLGSSFLCLFVVIILNTQCRGCGREPTSLYDSVLGIVFV